MNYRIKEDILFIGGLNFSNLNLIDFERELSLKTDLKLQVIGSNSNEIYIRFYDNKDGKFEQNVEYIVELAKNIADKYRSTNTSRKLSFVVIPTGADIKDGSIFDYNSIGILKLLIEYFPNSEFIKLAPIKDEEDNIKKAIDKSSIYRPDYIFFIGGTGGGNKYVEFLNTDLVHSQLHKLFPNNISFEIYGDNGHLYSKVSISKIEDIKIFNLPGPSDECIPLIKIILENIDLNDKKLLTLLENKLKKIYKEKFSSSIVLKDHEDSIENKIIFYRSMGLGARQISKLLIADGFDLKYYQVQYRLSKIEGDLRN